MLAVQVLGPIRAWRDGTALALGPAGRKAVFAVLALAHGKPVPRAELVDALWGERPPASAANIIHTHVKHLRQLLEPERGPRSPSTTIPTVGDGYALDLPADAVDASRFRSLVARASALAHDEPPRAADLLTEALGLWHGRPLADVPLLDGHPGVVALAGEHRAALARHAELMTAVGAARDVLPALVEHVATHGLDEMMHALLIRAYTAAGQRDLAFDTYHGMRRRLMEELGVGPGPELTAAYLNALEETPGDDATAPAEPALASSGVNQLPGDVHGFTGRQAELAELGRVLTAERSGVPIIVVCGAAGVGKTALALHWAHRVRSQFPDGQLHVDLRGYDPRSPMAAEDALGHLLDGLGVTGADVPVDPDQRAARYRAELADRRVLIVLDNASTVDQVRSLLPGTSSCLVLVTSRSSLAGLVALHGAHRLDVDQLSTPDSLALLRALIGERVRREPEAAADLAERCGRLPLALRIAAELAASRPASTLAELTGELTDRRQRLRVLDTGDDARAAVRTVFSWSYAQLRPEVARAFRRLGLHPGPDVTPFALAALTGTDQDEARRSLDVLARNSLVRRVPGDRFVVHDLLRAYAEELAGEHDPEPERLAAVDRLLAIAAAAMDLLYPVDRPHRPDFRVTPPPAFPTADAARAWLDAERSTLVTLCRAAERDDRPGYVVDLANTLYRYLESGHYADASTIYGCALRAARRAGEDDLLAAALTNLGALRRILGDYDQAVGHLREAIALHRRTGGQHGVPRALSNLGIVQERLGEYDEAVSLQREALAVHRRLGNRHGEAAALLNLGNAYNRPGHHPRAAECLELALDLFRRLDDVSGQASALANLGDVCASLRRYPDAVRHLDEARELFQRLHHSYGVAVTLSNLGTVHTRLGDWSQAHRCHTSALETFRDIGHRYGEASALNGLGETLRAAGRPDEALAAHADALRIATETGDQDEQDRARAGLGSARSQA
ncbi:AfsR/SARP family transcriptional regulator [Saccharothrix luteola]|uniref:AfsR/SARP family transcriptional regulator n=1 Tax=Saccharothrix luteola TaxID=2893018 RepID=UPI001E47A012|nr:tetratricopeptide repeat protein [Saccharothrix luteola]MCC8249407.1 tetratricopeptide repeat protein [Saccharothrix luteola]